jgi:hypothetical protein
MKKKFWNWNRFVFELIILCIVLKKSNKKILEVYIKNIKKIYYLF